jgi:hypothetical protein
VTKSSKKKAVFILKVAVTIGLCGIIFAKADWSGIWAAIANVKPVLVAVVFVCMLLNIVLSAKKWQVLVSIHRMDMHLFDLTKYYLTGMFFSNFLPSTVGGDGYRMYKVFSINCSKAGAVMPVVIERLSGILALLFLGFLAAVISLHHYGDQVSEVGLLFGFLGTIASILFVMLVLNRRFQIWFMKFSLVPASVKNIFEHLNEYRRNRAKLLQCAAISILFYLFLFSYRYILLYAIGETCSFSSFVVVTMLSILVANLPVSINGIGLLDGSFIYLISTFGVGYEAAITFMLLQRTLTSGISLLGGLIYMRGKDDSKTCGSSKEDLRHLKKSVLQGTDELSGS